MAFLFRGTEMIRYVTMAVPEEIAGQGLIRGVETDIFSGFIAKQKAKGFRFMGLVGEYGHWLLFEYDDETTTL